LNFVAPNAQNQYAIVLTTIPKSTLVIESILTLDGLFNADGRAASNFSSDQCDHRCTVMRRANVVDSGAEL
jgi:hypothetical protein